MLTLFETTTQFNVGVVSHPEFSYLKNGFKRELKKFESYYRRNAMVVRSGHLIVQLLQSLHVSTHYDPDTYVNLASDQITKLAMAYKLTTPHTAGKLHDGIFYGSSIKETILLTNTPLPISTIHENWRKLDSVSVLDHPYDSLGVWIADGVTEIPGEGYATIEINLPKLALQYRMWLDMRGMDLVEESIPAITQFVHRYVLPNMMRSHLDLAILNRFMTHFLKDIPSSVNPSHPFFMVNYDRQMDRVIETMLERVIKRRLTFPQLLQALPAVYGRSALDTLSLPKVAKTRQIDWALTLSRLRQIAFLVQINDVGRSYANGHWLNRISRGVKLIGNDRVIANQVGRVENANIEDFIEGSILPYL